MSIADTFRAVENRARRALAFLERNGRTSQPVELIPGMPAAPEPCCLFSATWEESLHPVDGVAQVKVDGMRALYLQSRIVTRQALPLDAALHCLPALVRLEEAFGQPMVFDGEYQEPDGFNATLAAHKRGRGVGVFWLFDAVPYAEWAANRFTQPLRARLDALAQAWDGMGAEPFLAMLPAVPCHAAGAREMAGLAWARSGEGLVVKDARSLYTRGRTKDWLKLKRSASIDVVVVDVAVPDGDLSRGVALVRFDGRMHKIAAMPADVRALMRGDVVYGAGRGLTGRMVEIEFMERTETGALRQAKITRLRPDKERNDA